MRDAPLPAQAHVADLTRACAPPSPVPISEETGGSISCPSAFNLVAGYLPSYGVTSRAGAGLLR